MYCKILCLATFFAGVSQAQVLEMNTRWIIEDRRLEGAARVRSDKARLGTRRPELDTKVRTERKVVRVGKLDDEAKRTAREKSREIQNEKAEEAKRIASQKAKAEAEEKRQKEEVEEAKRIASQKAKAAAEEKRQKEEAERIAREKAEEIQNEKDEEAERIARVRAEEIQNEKAEEAKRIARVRAEEIQNEKAEEAKRIAREKAEAEEKRQKERIVEENKTKTDTTYSNPDLTVGVTDPAGPFKFKGTPVSNAITSGEETDSTGFDSTHALFLGGAIGFACIVIVLVFQRRRDSDSNYNSEDEDEDIPFQASGESSFRGSNDSSQICHFISIIPSGDKTDSSQNDTSQVTSTEVKTTVRPSHCASDEKQFETNRVSFLF